MERKNLIYLIIIVIIGAILRFALLVWNPPSLNWDEISHGYNAYSILKTGMDQWGQKLPIFNFRAYGDYPTTLNLYLTIPFIVMLGLSTFAIRFPHALIGTLTIISVYFLATGITKKRNIGLVTAYLTAVGAWYVFTSRFVLQSNLSVFLLITASAFFVNRDKNKLLFPFSLLLFTLTLFSYHTTRIFSPIFLVGLTLIYKSEIKNKLVYLFIALFLALSAYILINPNATTRGNVLFIIDQSAVNKIDAQRSQSKLPPIVSKFIYNRPIYFAEVFSRNYINYFSPQFLFFNGGTQYQFSVPGYGLIYPVSLPFFYIGLLLLIWKSFKSSPEDGKNYKMLLLWLMFAPIPASLTNESFTVVRATTMLPVPEILISLGLYWFAEKLPQKIRISTFVIYIMLVFLSAENYFVNYFTSYRTNYSWSWQYGYEQAVNYAKDNHDAYDKIIVTKKYGEPHEYFLFYLKYDPLKYLSDPGKITFFQSNWWWVDHFDKFWFVNDWQIPKSGNTFVTESKRVVDCYKIKCLLITSPGNFPTGWKKVETINFLNDKTAFEIYQNF